MKKRMSITIISIVGAVLLLCGWTAFASSPAGTAGSASVSGQFKSIGANGAQVIVTTDQGEQTLQLAKSVWVYRNGQKAQLSDLKPGDRIEAVFNSKNQAAYIKASSEQPAAPKPEPEPTPTQPPAPQQTQSPTPEQTPPPAAAPQPNSAQPESSPQANKTSSSFEDTDLKIDGKHFKLYIEPKHAADGTQYELTLKPDDGPAVHLKGDEAASWIKDLLGSVDLQSANAERQLLQAIAEHFGIDAGKLQIQMKANPKQAFVPSQQQQINDDDDRNDDHGRGKSDDHGSKDHKFETKQKHGKDQGKQERD